MPTCLWHLWPMAPSSAPSSGPLLAGSLTLPLAGSVPLSLILGNCEGGRHRAKGLPDRAAEEQRVRDGSGDKFAS